MYVVQISQMRFIMIRKMNNSAIISCFIMFHEISICMNVLAMTPRLPLVPSQLMSFLRLVILVLYRLWVCHFQWDSIQSQLHILLGTLLRIVNHFIITKCFSYLYFKKLTTLIYRMAHAQLLEISLFSSKRCVYLRCHMLSWLSVMPTVYYFQYSVY